MDDEKVKNILEIYRTELNNIISALRFAHTPESLIALYTFNLPQIGSMLPEDAINTFTLFRDTLIVYLYNLGWRQKKIAKFIGFSASYVVEKVLKEHRNRIKIEKANLDEVIN